MTRRSPIKKRMMHPRFWIRGILTIIVYILLYTTLFHQFFAFKSMIFAMIFFVVFHFFYLEIRELPIWYLLVLMLLVSGIQWLIIGYHHIFLIASLLSINLWIVYMARLLQWVAYERVYRDSTSYFMTWGYMFTVFLTIAYSCFVVGYYKQFPFTCEDLRDASNSVIDIVTQPLKLWVEWAKHLKDNIQLFFATRIGDLQRINIQTNHEPSFLDNVRKYKTQRIDQAIHDNEVVNMGICEYVLHNIKTIYARPGFEISAIVLMFLIFYGFIRIEFWLMTGISLLLFRGLYMMNIYRVKSITRKIDHLE